MNTPISLGLLSPATCLFFILLTTHTHAQEQTLSNQSISSVSTFSTISREISSTSSIIPTHYTSRNSSSATHTFSDIYPTYTNNYPSASPTSNDNSSDGTGGGLSWAGSGFYYYIPIAIVFIAIVFFLWAGRRRHRRLRQLRRQNARQTALLQDAAGWPNNRRWIHGSLPGGEHGAGDVGEIVLGTRRDEGLDESGEAPPPYKRANDVEIQASDVLVGQSSSARVSGNMAAPAVAADGVKPPEYEGGRER